LRECGIGEIDDLLVGRQSIIAVLRCHAPWPPRSDDAITPVILVASRVSHRVWQVVHEAG
ncbi:MAG: hypothetical protein KDB45_15360, partial [Mycobacterium sp.]|nr:hypothetical protein [Mycobacterium sp.]